MIEWNDLIVEVKRRLDDKEYKIFEDEASRQLDLVDKYKEETIFVIVGDKAVGFEAGLIKCGTYYRVLLKIKIGSILRFKKER